MPRGSLFFLWCTAALAQAPPPDPFDRAMQSAQQARAQGNPAQAASWREEARGLLEQAPAGSPQWAGHVQNLAQSYQGSGRHAQARAVVQDALDRANALAEWNPVRVQLMSTMADFWQQDGNLLKALPYREKVIAALEAAPAALAAAPPLLGGASTINGIFVFPSGGRFFRSGPGPSNSYQYEQLSELYRQLGRPDAAARAVAKMRTLIKDNLGDLASSYEREGNLDQARALYWKQAQEAAAKPQAQTWEVVGPLQAVASLYEREGRWAEAAATLQQAASRMDASTQPEAPGQATGMRLNLANLLQRSGQSEAAEQVYQTLFSQSASASTDQQVQVLQQYANHLSETGRGAQGAQMLKDFLANHAALQPWQEGNLLSALSQIARNAGETELADKYQRGAQEKFQGQAPPPPSQRLIGPELQKAQAAVNQGNLDEALNLALDAISSAAAAPDGEQIAWQAPNVAAQLAGKKAPDKAEQVYRALFPVLEARAVDNVQPLNQALQQYARFLVGQKDRLGDAALAIDRYRDSVAATQGADTSGMAQAQELRIELARAKEAPEEAVQRAEELLALEESLSGPTSSPYLRAAQTAASVYQASGKTNLALALHPQIVAIADLTFPANDAQRGFVRINAAMEFAAARQFGEAERLASEAMAVGQSLRPPRTDLFRGQLEQIQRMKAAAESGAPPPATPGSNFVIAPNGKTLTRGGWFETTTPANGAPRP